MPEQFQPKPEDPRYQEVFEALAAASMYDESKNRMTFRPGSEGVAALTHKRDLIFRLYREGATMDEYNAWAARAASELDEIYVEPEPEEKHDQGR